MPQVVIVSSLGPQGQVGPQGPSGSFDNISGSFLYTSSFNEFTASVNAFTASYNTGSFTGSFTGSATLGSLSASSAFVTGNVTVLGTASINTLIVNQTQLSTGSNQLGDAADDTQTLYGSVIIPTGSLAVSGNASITGSISIGTTAQNVIALSAGYGSSPNLTVGTNTIYTTYQIASGNTDHVFYTRGTSGTTVERLRIKGSAAITDLQVTSSNFVVQNNALYVSASGLVGIGTSTPGVTLDVVGNIRASSFILNSVTQTRDIRINSTDKLTFQNTSSAEVARFDNAGNWGFGITSPTAKLHVSGTIKIESTAAEKHLEFTRVGNNYISTANGGALLINVVGTAAENTSLFRVYPSAVMVGSGIPLTTATFNVRGSGTTSGTTALLVQNANASSSLAVLDNGNVGIGTTDPTSKLDVAGDAIFQTNTYIRVSGTTNSGLNLMNTNTGSIFAKFGYVGGGANDSFIGSLTNNNFSIRSANIDRITVLNTGNVGIGTITPSASLHISGASPANLLRIDSPASSSILFVSGSGNIGIGTVTPSALLQVGAAIGTGTNVYSFTGYKFGVENGTSRFIGPEVTSSNQSTVIVDFVLGASAAHQNPTGLLTFTGRDRGNNFNSGILGYIGIAKSTSANSSGSGNLVFGTAADSSLTSTERMRITSTGNIGIGTTTPSASLHISGSSGSVLFEIDSNSQQNILYVSGSGNVGIGTNNPINPLHVVSTDGRGIRVTNVGGGQDALLITNVSSLVRWSNGSYIGSNIYYTQTLDTQFQTFDGSNVVTRLSIKASNGFIGLGTTTPSASLHIIGSSGSALLRVDSDASSSILFVTGSGNVGIGTSTPTQKLDVDGAVLVRAGNAVYFRDTTSYIGEGLGLNIVSGATRNIRLNAGGSDRMFVSASGNVGIGTSTPTSTLDIQSTTTGSIRISGSAGSQITLVRPTAGLIGYVRYLTGQMEIGTNSSDALYLNTLNTTRLVVQTNGDIGIGLGVGTPSARLNARGSGTTSATNTFRLENSSALPSLIITDDLNSRFFGNVGIGAAAASGSFHISASASTSSAAVYIYKSGSTTLDIQGSQGQLFSVTDQLSGSLMSVNDISGLPILEVFSDDRVVMGSFASPALIVTGSAVRFPATGSAAPTYSGSNGETIFTVIGGNAFMYVWLGGRWRSGSLA